MFEDSRGRSRVGVIVPYTNTNLEPDLNSMRPAGVSFHFTRISSYEADRVPGVNEMKRMADAPVHEAIDLLGATRPHLMLYGCTSAALTLGRDGERAFADRMSEHCGVKVITPANAIVDALREMAVSKIAICSPYDRELSGVTANYFSSAGFDVASLSNPEQDLDSRGQGSISPDEVIELALRADHGNAEAIVMACTDMRAVECIETIESMTRNPVVSSNQALMYAALKALEIIPETIPGALGGHRLELSPGSNDHTMNQAAAQTRQISGKH